MSSSIHDKSVRYIYIIKAKFKKLAFYINYLFSPTKFLLTSNYQEMILKDLGWHYFERIVQEYELEASLQLYYQQTFVLTKILVVRDFVKIPIIWSYKTLQISIRFPSLLCTL